MRQKYVCKQKCPTRGVGNALVTPKGWRARERMHILGWWTMWTQT